MPILLALSRLVFFNAVDLFRFLGAVHVLGLDTIRPLRDPDVQRYLRASLLPLRLHTCVTLSVISAIFIIVSCLISARFLKLDLLF